MLPADLEQIELATLLMIAYLPCYLGNVLLFILAHTSVIIVDGHTEHDLPLVKYAKTNQSVVQGSKSNHDFGRVLACTRHSNTSHNSITQPISSQQSHRFQRHTKMTDINSKRQSDSRRAEEAAVDNKYYQDWKSSVANFGNFYMGTRVEGMGTSRQGDIISPESAGTGRSHFFGATSVGGGHSLIQGDVSEGFALKLEAMKMEATKLEAQKLQLQLQEQGQLQAPGNGRTLRELDGIKPLAQDMNVYTFAKST